MKGSFTPSAEAASLSKAPHFASGSTTPVVVRFSSSTGIPNIPDTDGQANPRGIAIRFVLGADGHRHTDIIAHSTPYFPVRTGEGFQGLLEAIGGGTIGEFLEKNPAAARFVSAPKPSPVSFATEKFYGVNAFKFTTEGGAESFVRYRIEPAAGVAVLSDAELASKSADYLYEELVERVGSSAPVVFKLLVQIAESGDQCDDATVLWPESRKVVELGTVSLTEVAPTADSAKEEQKIIFDPIPRVDGIEPTEDPLLQMRASIYLISGRERRAAPALA